MSPAYERDPADALAWIRTAESGTLDAYLAAVRCQPEGPWRTAVEAAIRKRRVELMRLQQKARRR